MVSEANQPFLILVSDTSRAKNTFEMRARRFKRGNRLPLSTLTPRVTQQTLNTSHASQKTDHYYLILICQFDIRQTSEWAA